MDRSNGVTEEPATEDLTLFSSVNDFEFTERGIGERIYNLSKTYPKALNQIDTTTGTEETTESVRDKAIQVATELIKHQLTIDDVVMLCCKNRPEEAYVAVGVLFAGLQLCLLEPELEFEEMQRIAAVLNPKIIFCDPRVAVNFERGGRNYVIYAFGKTKGRSSFRDIFSNPPSKEFEPVKIDDVCNTPAVYITTEGVMGPPKIVKISHYALMHRLHYACCTLFAHSKRVMSQCPLTGSTDIIVILSTFENHIVRIIPKPFEERTAIHIIHHWQVDTLLLGTNNAVKVAQYYTQCPDYSLQCLKGIIIGGTPTTPKTVLYLRQALPGKIFNLYSLTECGFVAGQTSEDLTIQVEKPASCGRVVNGSAVRIIDFKTMKPVGPDTWGELCYKGNDMCLGYAELSIELFMIDDYFRTGDVAEYDDQGCIYIHGRLDDIFISKGNIFSGLEIEEIFYMHPNITECVAFSNGALIILYAVLDTKTISSRDLFKWISGFMATFMMPNKIYVLNELPKTRNGKIRKCILPHIIYRKSLLDFS